MLKKLRSFLLLPIAIMLIGQGCTKAPSAAVTEQTKPLTLNWWSVYNDAEAIQPVITAYRAMHPNVTINLRNLRLDEYEKELVDALAEDRGPDIMSLHNTWIPKYQSKLSPIPESITVPFTTIQGTIKKEKVTELRTSPGLSILELKKQFIDTVANDVIMNVSDDADPQKKRDRIFALPLSTDSLALYYNKDLLNSAGIAEPPAYWDEFQKMIPKLTKQDSQGNIVQSGAALGTAKNVERFSDILSVLMMQNGTHMTDGGYPSFHLTPQELSGRTSPPADDAVIFYTDFANPAKEVYTWNDKQKSSLLAFASGQTAFYFGYDYNLPSIRSLSPKLNLGIAKLPQIRDNPEVNFANYWAEGVSKKSANLNWAWDFLQFAASAPQASRYLDAAKRPTALRSLIDKQRGDIDLSVFASQMLTAKSWYRGKSDTANEQAFADLIYAVLNGHDIRQAVINASNRVSETYR
jgi:ABC-type glycerol-3-phosphate transport system substrate-binding protein